MASQDIISQLRDLQLAIDDFTDLNSSTHTTSSEIYSGQPPPTAAVAHEDKVLIEEKQTSLLDSVLPFQIEDDDFSSLMEQFADIQRTTQHDDTTAPMEKTLLTPTSTKESKNNDASTVAVPLFSRDNQGEKHWLQDDDAFHCRRPPPPPPPPPDSPSTSSSIVSRATSTLSMNSKKSTRSYKSIKGKYRSHSSNTKKSTTTKYHARTYDEMMRIPDIHERIQFYDKTYQLCLRADSNLVTWITKFKSKGIPQPMLEGYVPPPRPIRSSTSYMSLGRSDSRYFKTSSSLSGSISMILRKGNSANPQPVSTPRGMSRSFGQQQGLDKTHRMAHSMYWRQDHPPLPSTPSFSPAPSLRFKSSTHYMAPLPPRITPMTHPSAPLPSSPSVGVSLSSSLSSSRKKKSSSRQHHQRIPSSIPPSPTASLSISASKKQQKMNGLGFDHMRTPSSSSSISLSMRRSKKQLGYSGGNAF